MSLTIEDLPHAIIEYIFSYLSPYRDLKQCRLVNKCWYELVQAATKKIQRDFHFAVTTRKVCWHHCHVESGPSISRRYSHSSCICGNSMYVFGGCTTASTTFNDLWRLDLATRCWIRPLATGTYPPPKACASMVCYRDNLILLGGWTHTSPYPLHQAWHIFNHLHVYNTNTNRWNHVVTSSSCPGMAGHTASILGDRMVVFGGLHCQSGWGPFSSSNDIWVLDLKCMVWKKQEVTSPTPHPRYGHSQINIDEKHIMILGGCGGPNMLFSDIWLLTVNEDPALAWEWKEMKVMQKANAAPQLTFHPACKVNSKVVVLSKARWSRMSPACFPQLLRAPSRIWVPPCAPQVFARPEPRPVINQSSEKENCVNGKKGMLKRHLNRSLQGQRTGSNASSSDDDDIQGNAMKKGVSTVKVNPHEVINVFSQPSTSQETAKDSNKLPCIIPPDGVNIDNPSASSLVAGDKITKNGHPLTTSCSSASRFTLSARPNSWRNRQRQLEGLDRMEQRLRTLRSGITSSVFQNGKESTSSASSTNIRSIGGNNSNSIPKNPLCLYVLDISHAVSEGDVSWIPTQQQQSHSTSGLEEVILYSLLLGRRELVMFGGIQKDLNSYQSDCENFPQIVSNSLHFISGLRYVI